MFKRKSCFEKGDLLLIYNHFRIEPLIKKTYYDEGYSHRVKLAIVITGKIEKTDIKNRLKLLTSAGYVYFEYDWCIPENVCILDV